MTTPLLRDVFENGVGAVRSVSESTALQWHFGNGLSIVPLVALKAQKLAWLEFNRWSYIHTEIGRAVLQWMSRNEIWDAIKIDRNFSGDVGDIIDGTEKIVEGSPNPLFLPQSGAFRLADYGTIDENGFVTGYYRSPTDMPWHNNDGRMDPIITEEIAAQIVTYAYAARAGAQARDSEDSELNPNFPLLTFETSKVWYHTGVMPKIADGPEIILTGQITVDEKRKAGVAYTLYHKRANGEPLPIISGEISAYKGSIALVRRSVRMLVERKMVQN